MENEQISKLRRSSKQNLLPNDPTLAIETHNQQELLACTSPIREERTDASDDLVQTISTPINFHNSSNEAEQFSIFKTIPDELLIVILAYLEPQSFLAALLVCKRWYSVGMDPQAWRHLLCLTSRFLRNNLEKLAHELVFPNKLTESLWQANDRVDNYKQLKKIKFQLKKKNINSLFISKIFDILQFVNYIHVIY